MTWSQTARVLAYLRANPEGLTPYEAFRLDMGMRLAARILDARELLEPGESISVTMEPNMNGGRHARYRLVSPPRQAAIWEEGAACLD